MDMLKKRKTALWIFIAVVLVFTVIGSHRSLTNVCDSTEELFFDRELLIERRKTMDLTDGSVQPTDGYYSAPADHLKNCADYANRILSLIKDDVSEDIYNEIRDSRRTLLDALGVRDISDIYDAQTELYAQVTQLDEQVITNNYDDFNSVYTDFINANHAAESSGYNQIADHVIRTELNEFPANILRVLTGVELPEKYE